MLSDGDSLLEDQKHINATARVSLKTYSLLGCRNPHPLPSQLQRRRRGFPRRTPIPNSFQNSTPKSIHPAHLPHKHVPSRLPHALPLLHQHRNFAPSILDDKIRLDIVAVVAKRVLELGGDAVNAVEGEDDEDDDGNGPPAHFVDEGEGEDAAE